jgi:type I restriction enzyme S subunit
LVNQINQKVEHDEDLPLPYIGLENIVPWKGELVTHEVSYVPEGVSNTFYEGCILFGKLRPYLAKACITAKKGLCSSELLVLEPLKEIVPEFLLNCLLSDGFIKDVDSSTFGSKMPRASWDYIGNIKMPVLSKSEQIQIVDQINQETSKIDILINKAETAVNKLQEYKTALISAAVTGKIKVTDQA